MTSAPSVDPAVLAQSHEYCRRITREQAANFYWGLRLLPEPKRSAMFALYAWMRLIDDIADDERARSIDQRMADLDDWRSQTRAAIDGTLAQAQLHPIWPAFADMVRRYQVPMTLFDDAIAGQRQDLSPVVFETFEELKVYCYRVAGTVGIASIHIWGFDGSSDTLALANQRGIALQLTNILRDLREDAGRGRLYLPREDLVAMNLSDSDLRVWIESGPTATFEPFIRHQIARAEACYRSSAPLDERIDPDSRPALAAMTQIYHGLLGKIAVEPRRILRQRISLSLFSKLRIGFGAMRAARRARKAP